MSPTADQLLVESEEPELKVAKLRILATSDLHMNMVGFDYYSDRFSPQPGLIALASLVEEARTENVDGLTLLFDNGDSLQGTPLGEFAARNAKRPHVLMRAFKKLEFDALGLGNHDFNFGLESLERAVEQAPCPVVCSNLRCKQSDTKWADCAVLDRSVEREGHQIPLRIGLLSVLPPQTAEWDAHLLHNKVVVEDMVPSARKVAKMLRNKGCDIIIALAHTGLKDPEYVANQENAILPLAQIQEIDALVAGHTHLRFPGPDHQDSQSVDSKQGLVHNKPVVMPGFAGSHLGVIDLDLSRSSKGRWKVLSSHSSLRETEYFAPTEASRNVARITQDDHDATRVEMQKPVGSTSKPLHSYFALFGPDEGLKVVAAAQAKALRQLLAGRPEVDLPMLSASAPLKSGGLSGPSHYTDIAEGQLFQRHVADLHVYPNNLSAVVITGADLRDWLEMSAGIFRQAPPHASDHHLLASDMPGHNFDVIFGLDYEIDVTRPPRFTRLGRTISPQHQRVRNLKFDGHPVRDDQQFLVASNSYRANGGGRFPFIETARQIALPTLSIQSVVRGYLDGSPPTFPKELQGYPWRFQPKSGLSVIVPTGPRAIDYLDDLSGFQVEGVGISDDGFLRLRLCL